MSRTLLIKALKQAYQMACLSQRKGIPVDEIVGIISEYKTRRQLLKVGLGAAVFTAATLYKGEDPAIAKAKSSSILIVGAGIAGLTAAYRLYQAGIPVEVIEARSTIGGRMSTISNALGTGIPIEMGGEFIDTGHKNIQSLAKELGLNLINIETPEEGLITNTFYINNRKVPQEEVIREFALIAPGIAKDSRSTSDISYKNSNSQGKKLDHLSILDYLDSLKTPEILRTILDVAYNIEFGIESSEQSALNLISLIGEQSSGFNIFGDSDETYYIDGGNQQLPKKLASILGDRIQTNTVLEGIKILSDGRYLVAMNSSNRKLIEKKYEKVILAIPFSVLRNIPLKIDLPVVKRLAINNLGYGSNSKLVSIYSEKFWRNKYQSTGNIYTDLGFQNTWECAGGRNIPGVGILINFTGGNPGLAVGKKPLKTATKEFTTEVEKVFPGMSSAQIENKSLLSYWINKDYNLGSYSCYRLGQYTTIRGAEGERVGNLFFIGEHTSLDFGGYMEGGCQTGNAVAREIIKNSGQNR